MSLQVIGAGWGRTGTYSLYTALEQLGFRTHHMHEVFLHPEQSELFLAAARGSADWDAIYEGYAATVDWPGAAFWRELAGAYPDAKVLLSVRDPQDWYESYCATVQRRIIDGGFGTWDEMVRAVVIERDFDGEPEDRDHLVRAFERHTADVIATIPPERLLVYRVTDGWEPLCAFLGVDVPDESFPHTNDRESFARRNNDDAT
jgi:hypothetical protein